MEVSYILMKKITLIDKFYLIIIATLIILAGIVIYTLDGVFKAFIVSREIDEKIIAPQAELNTANIQKALKSVKQKEIPPLDLTN